MGNPTSTYVTELGLQQPSASDLTDGTTGTGAVVLAGSPALTGNPTAPTQLTADSTTKLATTAFVHSVAAGSITLEVNGTPNASQSVLNLEDGSNIHVTDLGSGNVSIALITSPALTGTPTAPTQALGDASTAIATDAFVAAAVTAGVIGADTLNVNGVIVVSPFSFTALVNGSGPVGETKVDGRLVQNNQPCMVEKDVNFAGSGQRAITTIFQNSSSVPILVQVNVNSTAGSVVWTAFADSSPSPSTVVYKTVGSTGTTGNANDVTLTFFVMPGQYYKVTSSTGTPNLQSWREFQMVTGTFTDSGEIHASRSLTTIFQNTTGNAMFVVVQIASVNAASSVQGLSDTQASGPTNIIDDATQTSSGANTVTVLMIVPNNHYYKVIAASGSLSLWHEYQWTIPCIKSSDMAVTSGDGLRRSMTGATSTISNTTSPNIPSFVMPQLYQNSTKAVRWVQQISTNTAAQGLAIMSGGDGIPPFLTNQAACRPNGASSPRHLYIPVMPSKFYGSFDAVQGTLALTHWWEYALGTILFGIGISKLAIFLSGGFIVGLSSFFC